MVKAQRVLTDGFITHEIERHHDAPWGAFGGDRGHVGKADVYNTAKPERDAGDAVEVLRPRGRRPTTCMAYYSPNGGGYGSPLKRPARKVLEDVLDGFYSVEHAREAYGVVVELEAETVDAAATESAAGAHERLSPEAAGKPAAFFFPVPSADGPPPLAGAPRPNAKDV